MLGGRTKRERGKEIRENEKMEGKEKGGEDRVDEKESARGKGNCKSRSR